MEHVENKSVKINRDEVLDCFKELNISREKMILFSNYIKVYYKNVYDTYLGKDILKTESDVRGHLQWCQRKTIDFFKKLNIHFTYKEKINDVLFNLFLKDHVYIKNSYDINYKKDIKFVDIVFNFDTDKTEPMINFINIQYNLIDQVFVQPKRC